MRRSMLLIAVALTLIPAIALAETWLPPGGVACEVVVQFISPGTAMLPTPGPDRRFGVRLNVESSVYAVLPADETGTVRFNATVDRPVPFSAVALYLPGSYAISEPGPIAGNQLATCGMNQVQTFGGT